MHSHFYRHTVVEYTAVPLHITICNIDEHAMEKKLRGTRQYI